MNKEEEKKYIKKELAAQLRITRLNVLKKVILLSIILPFIEILLAIMFLDMISLILWVITCVYFGTILLNAIKEINYLSEKYGFKPKKKKKIGF
jgi:hypothetical protein